MNLANSTESNYTKSVYVPILLFFKIYFWSVSDLKPQIYFARFRGLDEDRRSGEGQEVHREPDHRRLRVGGPAGEVRGKGRVRGPALLVQIRQGYRIQNVFRTSFDSRNDFGLVTQG